MSPTRHGDNTWAAEAAPTRRGGCAQVTETALTGQQLRHKRRKERSAEGRGWEAGGQRWGAEESSRGYAGTASMVEVEARMERENP